MKKSRMTILVIVLALCVSLLTGCSSTLSSHCEVYAKQMNEKINIWKSTGEAESAAVSTKTPLGTPANWTVAEDGSYSFSSVENAGYYIIYLYDKQSGSSSFAYMSANIDEDGSATHSGMLSDLFDYAYGLYDAQCIAYPALGLSDMKKSEPAACDFSRIGEVSEPVGAYCWDCFSGTLGVQLINVEEYAASSAPTLVSFTFTNIADSGDVITLSFENATMDTDTYGTETKDVTVGASYRCTMNVRWDESIVTNPSLSKDLGTVTLAADRNAMTEGYGYLNNSIYKSLDYPMVAENFDPAAGGSVGTWYFFVEAFTTNKGVAIPSTYKDCRNFQGAMESMGAPYHGGENAEFIVTPAEEVTEGSVYSYTLRVTGPREVVSLFDGFFWNDMPEGEGTVELHEDGTFTLAITIPQSALDNAGPWGVRAIAASTISGIWVENGDGTLTLSYDRSTAALS